MPLSIAALIIGIVLLGLSADKFVEGSAITARRLGIPPLLVGMLVIGFGSSMPEFVVSVLAAKDGNTGLALGNAFGSNITNIALILGITAVISPIKVKSSVLGRELPILVFVTLVCTFLLGVDGVLQTGDGWILIGLFVLVMSWSVYAGLKTQRDELGDELEHSLEPEQSMPTSQAIVYVIFGLIMLIISSRILVWGGVGLARQLGISDLIIGLTIVALGTSLPELASSVAAVRRNEHDLALGNVIGSNLFNTTIVIGIVGAISATAVDSELITRDIPILIFMTLFLFFTAYNFRRRKPRITRLEGIALLVCYVVYNGYLITRMF